VRLVAGLCALVFSLDALCFFLGDVEKRQLPREALETIALIRQGGPFPYERDGAVFRNRERLLPVRERGWYREYTVKTPGARDRGARRIVAGRDGTLYYTDDHYRSFKRILE
jgi:ribonuclease T1